MTRRVNVRVAAARLGISEGAVRQRIARGSLRSEKDEDGSVYVVLPYEASRDTGESTEQRGDEDLRALVEVLREQLQLERDANRENRRLLAAALERIPAIEAPPEATEAPESGEGAPYGTSRQEAEDSLHPRREEPFTDQGPRERRSWWRRFFGME